MSATTPAPWTKYRNGERTMSAPFHPRAVDAVTLAALDPSNAGEGRVRLALSDADRGAYSASLEGVTRTTAPGPWVSVTEQRTGTRVSIRAASCGLRCVCDMEVSATEMGNQK